MEQQKSLLEVVNTEKQMLALIYSKGILHDDVLELYHKIRIGYENLLLSSNQMVELQEIEHRLWKLHYELINEFRKRIRQRSFNSENVKKDNSFNNINCQSNTDKALEGFKSFLSEAAEFYWNLIVKLRKSCGLPSEIFLNYKDCSSFSVDPTKLYVCQHTCHRLLVCLGDVARYTENVKKTDPFEWSTAATYYLEAMKTWPDSGNPHNQLALLATYVGDSFLALYHCVRSLAVKEPFPDAWRNITLLFEENRSTRLPSLSNEMQFDFLNPSKRSYMQSTCHEDNSSSHNSKLGDMENICSEKFDLWPILVRTTSILLMRSSLEEFPCTLASALHSLEVLLALDDKKLTVVLESYQHLDSSRKGPYRAIQLVSIFIFIVHSLTESPGRDETTRKDNQRLSEWTPLAIAAIFICIGRVTERCSTGNNGDSCLLLPTVLVFLDWLAGALDMVEAYEADDRVTNALSYFFGALADLLDRIGKNEDKTAVEYTALWEDHELRGFYPLSHVHETLDFASHLDCMENYSNQRQCRSHRIFHAAMRIMETSKSSRELIFNDKLNRLVNSVTERNFLDQEPAETAASIPSSGDKEKPLSEETESHSGPKIQPTADEEEVILFKPITRRNSAPLYISKPNNDWAYPQGAQIQTTADEWLRRATSLSSGQNTEDTDFSFCSTASDSGHNRSFKHKEPLSKDSMTHPAGPPSLSAWVLSRGSPNTERDRRPNDFNKQKLSPIEEIASTSFSDLSIKETKNSQGPAGHVSTIVHELSPRVSTPTPSAPLLPDDAVWLNGTSTTSSYKGNEADGILGAAPGYTGWATVRPPMGFVDGYPPLLGMSSSEWLYHYRNSQNMAINHLSPTPFNAPALGNYRPNELSSFDLCDQWGNTFVSNPMLYLGSPQLYTNSNVVYGAEEQKRDKLFPAYHTPFPYGCGVGMELSSEQPTLLQYLKEKERQLQPGSQLRGPTFMGN